MAAAARAREGQCQEPGILAGSLTWVAGTQIFKPLSDASQVFLQGVGSQVEKPELKLVLWCGHLKWWLNPPYGSASTILILKPHLQTFTGASSSYTLCTIQLPTKPCSISLTIGLLWVQHPRAFHMIFSSLKDLIFSHLFLLGGLLDISFSMFLSQALWKWILSAFVLYVILIYLFVLTDS